MNDKIKKEILEWVKPICLSVIVATGLTLVIQPSRVDGLSMYPTLNDNDLLIVNKLSYNDHIPERGDIITFKSDLIDSKTGKKENLVKRVIALPGEHLVISNNQVFINDILLEEPYLDNVYTSGNIDIVIPDNDIFVMGDNREHSTDSRDPILGTISLDKVIGKADFRTYPFYKLGGLD